MEIIKANPQGFCKGVIRAIEITKNTLNTNPKPIYILGSIVHNAHITNAFKELGLIEIDEATLPKIKSGTIIFTAHGVSKNIYDIARSNNLNIVDATCPMVKKIHSIVNKKCKEGYQVAFLGKSNHEETKGVLGISNNVTLVGDDLTINDIKDKCILVCQTTLSFPDVLKTYSLLKDKYPNLELSNQICDATFSRQTAAVKASQNVDLAIVVGDKNSNNANTLVKTIITSCQVKAILIESVNDLIDFDFKNIKTVSLTSAASTPYVLVKEVENYLLNKNTNFENIENFKYLETN